MGIKNYILFIALFCAIFTHAEEKFLSISGELFDEETKEVLTNFQVKIVQDRLDSSIAVFSKSKFQVWAPANRRTIIYFIKQGYVTKQVYIDASYIPSIAFKQKQAIELEIIMTAEDKIGRRNFDKPIMTAQYEARENAFTVSTAEEVFISAVPDNYNPPFPPPVDTYKGAQPTTNTLALTVEYNQTKTKSNSEFTRIIQGILFADMNYCFFNERTNDANKILAQLKAIDAGAWGNLKNFDSPEYGKIIMRTVNREQSIDTLFALGAYVETSRLIFENFTSDSKVLVHLKKLKDVLNAYHPKGLKPGQADFVSSLKNLVGLISDLETTYTESLRTKSNFEMDENNVFIDLKAKNLAIYSQLIL